jgi:hypothetical protein
METIVEAIHYVMSNLRKGTHCPVCGKWCHADNRRFHKDMGVALVLIKLFFDKYRSSDWCHVENWLQQVSKMRAPGIDNDTMERFVGRLKSQRMREWSRLKHWDLLERRPVNPDEVVRGYWRITRLGVDFVNGRLRVPVRKWIFKDSVVDVSEELVSIHEILSGPGFTLEDLHNLVRP